jgi:hypothetical protein
VPYQARNETQPEINKSPHLKMGHLLNRRFKMIASIVDFSLGGGVGFVVGAFTPAVGRKIKALFVKDSKAVIAAAPVAVVTTVKKL